MGTIQPTKLLKNTKVCKVNVAASEDFALAETFLH